MKRYLIRHIGNSIILSSLEVSPTDDIAIPPDASVLTDSGWAILSILCGVPGGSDAAVVAKLSTVCTQAGMTLDNQMGTAQ